jgi:hypothetical protein
LTANARRPIRFVLADVPAGLPKANLAEATLLGARSAIAKRLTEILPGATFDDTGHGVFKRTTYTIGFAFEESNPATVHIELEGIDGIAALKRVVEKTGWQAVDPESLRLLDLEATRSAGAVVFLPAARARQEESTEESRVVPIVKHLIHVAAVIVVCGSWWWVTNAAPPGDQAPVPTISDKLVRRIAELQSHKAAYVKAVAPKFRSNPIVAQLFEFSLAEWAYTSGFGMGRFAKPERLTDAEFWARFQLPAPLPTKFSDLHRDGYRFEFAGDRCGPMANNLSAPQDDCDGFVYAASPVDDPKAPTGRLSFALLTSDGKIHYCTDDPCIPSTKDPTVDNTDPSSHDDLINGGDPAPTGLVASVLHSLAALIELAMGDNPGSLQVNAAEGSAIKDLRALARAEQVFDAMMNGVERFASPEALANPKMFAPVKMAPLLPGYFTQSVRFGYEFSFSGEPAPMSSGSFDWINPQYGSYVYIARPVAGGPAGRRSFAVYPDGAVYATAEARDPTRQDIPLGTQ